MTPDGSLVFAGSNTDGTVSIIETETGTIVATLQWLQAALPPRHVGRRAHRHGLRSRRRCHSRHRRGHPRLAWTLDGLASPRGVSIAPDSRTAFVTLADDPSVGIVDMTSHKLVRTIPVGASPDGVGYGPTRVRQPRGRSFARLHEAGCFVIPNPWDLGSARLLVQLGFRALATTSSGFAWSLGRPDNHVSLEQGLAHLRLIAGGVRCRSTPTSRVALRWNRRRSQRT